MEYSSNKNKVAILETGTYKGQNWSEKSRREIFLCASISKWVFSSLLSAHLSGVVLPRDVKLPVSLQSFPDIRLPGNAASSTHKS